MHVDGKVFNREVYKSHQPECGQRLAHYLCIRTPLDSPTGRYFAVFSLKHETSLLHPNTLALTVLWGIMSIL